MLGNQVILSNVSNILDIISNQGFINFISTFGLAALIVVFFVFFRDPKRDKYWREKYDRLVKSYSDLSDTYDKLELKLNDFWNKQCEELQSEHEELKRNYNQLKEAYIRLENDLRPESRMMSEEQSGKLAYIALDRDLYKLYYYLCEKIDNKRVEDISFFIEDSIQNTNLTWSKFTTPFPQVPRISNLYGTYKNSGTKLKTKMEEIINSDKSPEDKKDDVFRCLVNKTIEMKRNFDDFLHKLERGEAVEEYKDSEHVH